jgi:hypothetical protein
MQLGKPIPKDRLKPKPSKVTLKTSAGLINREAKGNKTPKVIHTERNRLLLPNLFDRYAPTKADAISTAKSVVQICKRAK